MAFADQPIVITPALDTTEIAYRAYVAGQHQPVPHGRGQICRCGAAPLCPVATALLADIAADQTRIHIGAGPAAA